MNTEITYTSSNTDLQTIDTFDLPTTHSIDYVIHINTANGNQTSHLSVTHDGTETGEILNSFTQSNAYPIDISTDIDAYTGRIRATPAIANSLFVISKNLKECALYSASTKSGKLIHHTSGVGLDLESSLNNYTIRDEDGNFYGAPSLIANSFMTVPIENELLTTDWIPVNGSELVQDGEYFIAQSSGQNPNYQYQEVSVIVGYSYVISANALYQLAEEFYVKEGTQRQQGPCYLRVGKSPGGAEYFNYHMNEIEELASVIFNPTEEIIYVSFGFGDRSNLAKIQNISLKIAAPFPTWNKDEGTIFICWNTNTGAILEYEKNGGSAYTRLTVGSGSVVYRDAGSSLSAWTLGSQLPNNKLAISYSGSNVTLSLNGDPVIANTREPFINIAKSGFPLLPYKFSYIPIASSNTKLVELSTNG